MLIHLECQWCGNKWSDDYASIHLYSRSGKSYSYKIGGIPFLHRCDDRDCMYSYPQACLYSPELEAYFQSTEFLRDLDINFLKI